MFNHKPKDTRRICVHGCGRAVLDSRRGVHFLVEHFQRVNTAVRVDDLDTMRKQAARMA